MALDAVPTRANSSQEKKGRPRTNWCVGIPSNRVHLQFQYKQATGPSKCHSCSPSTSIQQVHTTTRCIQGSLPGTNIQGSSTSTYYTSRAHQTTTTKSHSNTSTQATSNSQVFTSTNSQTQGHQQSSTPEKGMAAKGHQIGYCLQPPGLGQGWPFDRSIRSRLAICGTQCCCWQPVAIQSLPLHFQVPGNGLECMWENDPMVEKRSTLCEQLLLHGGQGPHLWWGPWWRMALRASWR